MTQVLLIKNGAFHDAGTRLDVPPLTAEKMVKQGRAQIVPDLVPSEKVPIAAAAASETPSVDPPAASADSPRSAETEHMVPQSAPAPAIAKKAKRGPWA
jgi:hypothetical protein